MSAENRITAASRFDSEYALGYEAGQRCEECPDWASVAWHLGYAAALGIPQMMEEILSGKS